ncbi:TPM domain-containing protein [Ancylobacter sp. IITR112]|uniref:TPM domain-containing protein n=1 Tax=Ancylobacter sp. IITR112 TaxID=3138073 RepID=UPI00352AAA21
MAGGLSELEQAAVAAAIQTAEAGTAGEIRVVVLTRPLVSPAFYALMWAALLALVLPWPLALFTALDTPMLLSLQACAFVAVGAALVFTPLGAFTVPRFAREEAGRAAAVDQFLSLGIHQTRGRTGVLILVAPADHLVEVVADEAIHARVGHEAWEGVCGAVLAGARAGRLGDGLVEGVAAAGRILARHVPPGAGDANELPDRMIVL